MVLTEEKNDWKPITRFDCFILKRAKHDNTHYRIIIRQQQQDGFWQSNGCGGCSKTHIFKNGIMTGFIKP